MECRPVSMNRMGIDIYQRYILGQQSWYTPNNGLRMHDVKIWAENAAQMQIPNPKFSYGQLLILAQNI